MKLRKSHITLPKQARSGLDLLPWCKDVNYALRQLAGISFSDNSTSKKSAVVSSIKPPFYVTYRTQVTEDEPPETLYYFKVHPGYVYEVDTYGSDAALYHEPVNLYTDGSLTEFLISAGDALYVKVELLANGKIGSADEEADPSVEIVVESEGQLSTFYRPRVDDDEPTGLVGTMYYKLASLVAGDPPSLDRYLSGSHICHHQDLPAILSTIEPTSGIGTIPKFWDQSVGAYKLRALISGNGQLGITTNPNDIEIRGNQKKAKITYTIGGGTAVDLVNFNDGLIMDGANEEDPEAPVAAQEFNIPIPDAGSSVIHPWKVTDGGLVEAAQTWNVRGGLVAPHGQGESIIVPDTVITIEAGTIYLQIERSSSTREILSAEILADIALVNEDDSEFQYFVLAQVGGADPIVQVQLQDIKVFEMLLVSNGSLKLGNFQMMGYNNYDLPA